MRDQAGLVLRESPGSRKELLGRDEPEPGSGPAHPERVALAKHEPLDITAALPRTAQAAGRADACRLVGRTDGIGAPSPAVRNRASRPRLTRSTLRDWGLGSLAEDAETIVGEFVANAVTHAADVARRGPSVGPDNLAAPAASHRRGICAVLDPAT